MNVTSFSLPGSSVVYPAGPAPVTVTDPVTGKTAGTVVVQPDGSVTFTPAAGFTGQVPAISYTVTSSDGQVSPGALAVTVLPGACDVPGCLQRDRSHCASALHGTCNGFQCNVHIRQAQQSYSMPARARAVCIHAP